MPLLWIGREQIQNSNDEFRSLREAGFFPVRVESTEAAVHLLAQFRVQLVVLQAPGGETWQECARLLAAGPAVVIVVPPADQDSIDRYLYAGCAAVIASSCTSTELTAALRRVVDGHRGIVCPAIMTNGKPDDVVHEGCRPGVRHRRAARSPVTYF
jgi:DNA-binding NarL/FixJ family response regulator